MLLGPAARSGVKIVCLSATLVFFIAACEFPKSADPGLEKNSARFNFTQAERISEVTKIIQRHHQLPSPLLDAYFDERPLYDNNGFGPTDTNVYLYLKVLPTELRKWESVLGEKTSIGSYVPEREKYPWWIDSKRFSQLEYYDAMPLIALQGWVAVSRTTGEMWVLGSKT